MEFSIVPRIYDCSIADEELGIETEAACSMARKAVPEEGLLLDVSAAAGLVGAPRIAKEAHPGSAVVTVFPDSGDKYLSEHFWNETE
jgi:cysteine synthase B